MNQFQRATTMVLLAAGLIAACGSDESGGGGDSGPDYVVITTLATAINGCTTLPLTAERRTSSGSLIPEASFGYSSTNTLVATVSGAGLVSAEGTGTVNIIVTSMEATSDTIGLTISAAGTVTVLSDTVWLLPAGAKTLNAVVRGCDAGILPGAAVTYHSSDSSKATVNTSGLVSGVAVGSAVVSVVYATDTTFVPVHVLATVDVVIDASPAHANRPYGVAVSSTGIAYVTRLDDSRMAKYDVASHALLNDSILVGSTPTGVAITPNGAEAYVASQDGNLAVVNVANDSVLVTRVITGTGFAASVSPDGSKAYIGTNMSKVYVFSTATRAITDSMPAGPSPNWFAFTPAGDKVFYSDYFDSKVRRAPVSTSVATVFATSAGGTQGIAVSNDGSRLYAARQDKDDVLVIDGVSGVVLDSIPLPAASPFGLVRRPNSDLLWVTTLSGHIIVVHPSGKLIMGDLSAGGTLRRLAFDAAGTEAVIADQDGRVIFAH